MVRSNFPTLEQVLLSLGVSYTNELDQRRALSYLHTWLATHAKHGPQIAGMPHPEDTSQKLSWVISLFEKAAASSPADADVQVPLTAHLCVHLCACVCSTRLLPLRLFMLNFGSCSQYKPPYT